jgi:cytochrome b pre-mRNA-processing protein 3
LNNPSFIRHNLSSDALAMLVLACCRAGLNMQWRKLLQPKRPQKDAMLGFLFRGLTAPSPRGARLFDAVTVEARRPHWYVEGQVPDTLDGRFAVLATVAALTIVRLEQLGEPGNALSVALTERFIEVMEAEHRELGLGDPSLGKTVRKLVGSLGRRTESWRAAIAGEGDWLKSASQSLYKDEPGVAALDHASAALMALWATLERREVDALAEGRFE